MLLQQRPIWSSSVSTVIVHGHNNLDLTPNSVIDSFLFTTLSTRPALVITQLLNQWVHHVPSWGWNAKPHILQLILRFRICTISPHMPLQQGPNYLLIMTNAEMQYVFNVPQIKISVKQYIQVTFSCHHSSTKTLCSTCES